MVQPLNDEPYTFDREAGAVPLAKMPDNVEIETTTSPDGSAQAVVNDRARQRSWSGSGPTRDAAATDAVRKFLGDRRSAEYVGKNNG